MPLRPTPEYLAQDLAGMQDPTRWPLGVLPLKRRTPDDLAWEVGLLHQDFDGCVRPVVYLTSLYVRVTRQTDRLEYPDFQSLQNDGWIVD